MPRSLAFLIFAAITAFFVCFFAWPVWTTVESAFQDELGQFTLQYFGEVFRHPLYREGLFNAFGIALGSTLGCLGLALPLALLSVRYAFPGKAVFNSLIIMPLVLPPFVGAIGFKVILGQAGALNSLLIELGWMDATHPVDWLGGSRIPGILLMQVLHLYPILFLNASAALTRMDGSLEEAAACLGCSPMRRFWRVTLPLIAPGVFAGATLVFIWSFTELGVPLVFDFERVTAVQIFRSVNDLSGNPFPYSLAVVLLVVSALAYLGSRILFGRFNEIASASRVAPAVERQRLPQWAAWGCSAVFAAVIFLAALPHLGVALLSVAGDWYGSVLPNELTLEHYRAALGHELTLGAIANSLKYSVLALLLALVLGIAIAYLNVRTRLWGRQLLDVMAMMPLAVPGVVLAFGWLAMTRPGQPFDWLFWNENSLLVLVVAYAVRRLPYVVRSAAAGFQQVSLEQEEAARSLGATPSRAVWRITLPLIAPHLLAGGLLAFAFCMLEVSDSMILAQQAVHYPITKAIYSLMMALGDGPNLASALGTWSMLFLTAALVGAGLLLGKKLGSLFR